jgi:hypothetical protein
MCGDREGQDLTAVGLSSRNRQKEGQECTLSAEEEQPSGMFEAKVVHRQGPEKN